MPTYSIIARDFPDGAERRLATRDRHVALSDAMAAEGKLAFGAAIIRDGRMVGSTLIGRFADVNEIKQWLEVEPYVTERVWQDWDITELRLGPSYAATFPSLAD